MAVSVSLIDASSMKPDTFTLGCALRENPLPHWGLRNLTIEPLGASPASSVPHRSLLAAVFCGV